MIGNPEMQDKGWEMHIKSLAGALSIVLGDPRKLSGVDLEQYRGYTDWLQLMANKHDIMSFRQDLPGFGEPTHGIWDGFQRINTETKSGGIIGVFKHGSVEKQRNITVRYLDPEKVYVIKECISSKIMGKGTGKELSEIGFRVELLKEYDGVLFEVFME